MHPFLPQHPLFRAYDIRGDYRYFTDDFVVALADTFCQHYSDFHFGSASTSTSSSIEHNPRPRPQPHSYPQASNVNKLQVVLGYDSRLGSLPIAKIFASVFSRSGIEVVWLGLVTTPIMAYWAEQYQGHGMVITASHSVKNYTGVKWLTAGKSPSSEQITEIYANMADCPISVPTSKQLMADWQACQPKLTDISQLSADKYAKSMAAAMDAIMLKTQNEVQEKPKSTTLASSVAPLVNTLVVDCLNGATSTVAHKVFARYANQVIILNDTPDGNFPLGNPDPSEAGRLRQLQSEVLRHNADLGFAFDGDGDRLVVVDNTGAIIDADNLLYLLATTALDDKAVTQTIDNNTEATEVIFDVKCSHHLPAMLKQTGATPIMSKTGSSHMRRQMQMNNSRAIFAGELSGHFIFNDGFFTAHDDGIYASVRLLNWLAKQSTTLHTIVGKLPTMISTADIYIPVEEQQKSMLARLISVIRSWLSSLTLNLTANKSTDNSTAPIRLPDNAQVSTIDGIRLDFEHGFGVIRPSNTSQSLTVRFAGDSMSDVKKIQQQLVALCKQFDEKLANQVAKIQPLSA